MTTKAQENVALIRRGFEAFNTGDIATLSEIIANDCIQHMAGNNRFTGDHKGRDNILAMYGEMAELTGGTMQAVLSDVYASEHGAVALYTAKATRNGKSVNDKFALVFQLMDGKAIDIDDVPLDGEVNDAFWE
jgi:ketosteroid isomerase-like protein